MTSRHNLLASPQCLGANLFFLLMEKYTKVINSEWLHEKHTENNCNCHGRDTALMKTDGEKDMEICLKCFGAKGCIY